MSPTQARQEPQPVVSTSSNSASRRRPSPSQIADLPPQREIGRDRQRAWPYDGHGGASTTSLNRLGRTTTGRVRFRLAAWIVPPIYAQPLHP
jgi:hypothetical protein